MDEDIIHAKINQKKIEVATLILNKAGFRAKNSPETKNKIT
jgi:hypothetical protein